MPVVDFENKAASARLLAGRPTNVILVTVRDNEPFEKALRRFRRKVEREGIRKDIKKNSFYLKPGEKRRLKQRLAEKRRRKASRRAARRAAKQSSRPSGGR